MSRIAFDFSEDIERAAYEHNIETYTSEKEVWKGLLAWGMIISLIAVLVLVWAWRSALL